MDRTLAIAHRTCAFVDPVVLIEIDVPGDGHVVATGTNVGTGIGQ
jgi:hypothetical protein